MESKKIFWEGQEYIVRFQHRYGDIGAPKLEWFNELGCPVGVLTTSITRCMLSNNETLISADVPQAHIIAELERVSMVRNTGRVYESKYIEYPIVEVLVNQEPQSSGKDHFVIGHDTPEWHYMWGRLGDLWINRFLPEPVVALNHFEVWQYMCSCQTPEGISHEFRHRNHPRLLGSNGATRIEIPASPAFQRQDATPPFTVINPN